MYFYYDEYENLQGPFSERAYAKWYTNKELQAGMILYDKDHKPVPIENVVSLSLKSRAKIMWEDDTMIGDETVDRTELDITLDVNQTYRPNETTLFQPDFTQLDEGVDEVDYPRGSEKDVQGVFLQKMVGMYIDRRALFNRRRQLPDNYVPFEFAWSRWVPNALPMCEALRGCTHLHNVLQEYSSIVFSEYLATINIYNHPCQRCNVQFRDAHEMLIHFVSVPHVHRMYSQDVGQMISMIDVYCIHKIVSEVDLIESSEKVYLDPFHVTPTPPSFFGSADVSKAFDSFKSTALLMQKVPALAVPRDSSDCCEYIEALILFRAFESNYHQTHKTFRHRRIGIHGDTHCSYCKIDFNSTSLENLARHILSEKHIDKAAKQGVSRSEMEYWITFLRAIINGKNAADWRFQERAGVSLQETDFPLCYNIGEVGAGDFMYSGGDVEPVLNYVRNQIRDSYNLLNDSKYRTSCRWCQVELCSAYGVLRHVLYDKCHVDRLKSVSNDDLRRLLKEMGLTTTMPLFQQTTFGRMGLEAQEKRARMQMLTNSAWVKTRKCDTQKMSARSFPMGLINRCEICRVDIELYEGILVHLCSEEHGRKLVNNARITDADFDYWMSVFNVKNESRRCR